MSVTKRRKRNKTIYSLSRDGSAGKKHQSCIGFLRL